LFIADWCTIPDAVLVTFNAIKHPQLKVSAKYQTSSIGINKKTVTYYFVHIVWTQALNSNE
jgi:hypothetical protein